MPAPEACDGDVWLALLPYPCSASCGSHVGLAAGAEEAPEVAGYVDPVPTRNAAGDLDVSLGSLGVLYLVALGEPEQYPDPLSRYPLRVIRHACRPRLVGSGRVYKSWAGDTVAERGRAARLARGAHNPKVGSSNLPPATMPACSAIEDSPALVVAPRLILDDEFAYPLREPLALPTALRPPSFVALALYSRGASRPDGVRRRP